MFSCIHIGKEYQWFTTQLYTNRENKVIDIFAAVYISGMYTTCLLRSCIHIGKIKVIVLFAAVYISGNYTNCLLRSCKQIGKIKLLFYSQLYTYREKMLNWQTSYTRRFSNSHIFYLLLKFSYFDYMYLGCTH